MKRFWIYRWTLLIFLCFPSCGLPDASSFETLLAPFILDDRGTIGTAGGYPQCTLSSGNRVVVELKVMVYNTESSFSGYNIYYAPSFSTLVELRSILNSAVVSHIRTISTSGKQFSTEIENTWIIKNGGNLPTVPAGSPAINGYNVQPTIAIIQVDRDPQSNYLQPLQYGFTVTAVSLINIAESVVSNVVAINASQATTTPTYCGAVL